MPLDHRLHPSPCSGPPTAVSSLSHCVTFCVTPRKLDSFLQSRGPVQHHGDGLWSAPLNRQGNQKSLEIRHVRQTEVAHEKSAPRQSEQCLWRLGMKRWARAHLDRHQGPLTLEK